MKTNHRILPWLALLALAFVNLQPSTLLAQGTAFTYQGQLHSGGAPANGSYDVRFTLYATNADGSAVAGPVTNLATAVTNGLFSTAVDLGPGVFNGAEYWLDLAVRTNGASAFTELTPRQALTPAPYAVFATSAGAVPGLLVQPGAEGAPDVIMGSQVNFVAGGVKGATISGGGTTNYYGFPYTNSVTADYGTVGGGYGNSASGWVATVGGGWANTASGSQATVGGGYWNIASADDTTVSGGWHSTASGAYSTVGGGSGNSAVGEDATVGGGDQNAANGCGTTVGGGRYNSVTNNFATVPGGYSNMAWGQFSLAAGYYAQATNDGAFVWADAEGTPFASTTSNQFSVRASGGVRLVTSGAGLSVDGVPVLTTAGALPGLTIEPNADGAPDVIMGSPVNFAAGGVMGATIGGGGATNYNGSAFTNSVTADFGTVAGGGDNTASYYMGTVGGGLGNTANGYAATVGGGTQNSASFLAATVGGGSQNSATNGEATVGGGSQNTASGGSATVGGGGENTASGSDTTVGGGYQNTAGGDYATVGGGYDNGATGYAATVGGGEGNSALGCEATVSGGWYNMAEGTNATVGGGYYNVVTGGYATVPGGTWNVAGGQYSFAAGYYAQATNDGSFVWADGQGTPFGSTTTNQFNVRASGGVRLVTGGAGLSVDGAPVLTTGGGAGLTIQINADGAPNVIMGSPINFVASGVEGATISGGGTTNYPGFGVACTNSVTADFGTVGGGFNNTASANAATVGGGAGNSASDDYATVGGGLMNNAEDEVTTVGGGYRNTASGAGAFVGGGGTDGYNFAGNLASGDASVVSGGLNNSATTNYATVAGGVSNTVGGFAATVGGGCQNTATTNCATVPGGYLNLAGGQFSFAAGYNAQATNDGAFVWADEQGTPFGSTTSNQFNVRASGGVRFVTSGAGLTMDGQLSTESLNIDRLGSNSGYMNQNGLSGAGLSFGITSGEGIASQRTTGPDQFDLAFYTAYTPRMTILNNGNVGIGNTNPAYLLVVGNAYCNGNTWSPASDRNLKSGFEPVDARAVLEKVSALPITSWHYTNDAGTPHLGPMAQDFYTSFGVGADDKHIADVDENGVALAAIQGLNQKVESENTALRAENAELSARLEKLERLVSGLQQP